MFCSLRAKLQLQYGSCALIAFNENVVSQYKVFTIRTEHVVDERKSWFKFSKRIKASVCPLGTHMSVGVRLLVQHKAKSRLEIDFKMSGPTVIRTTINEYYKSSVQISLYCLSVKQWVKVKIKNVLRAMLMYSRIVFVPKCTLLRHPIMSYQERYQRYIKHKQSQRVQTDIQISETFRCKLLC